MLVLAIDTTTKIAGVALYDTNQGILGEITMHAHTNHSEIISRMVADVFDIAKVSKENIDRIAVSVGPGSFTGIRIGVAFAKGLAMSLGVDIVGVNELDVLAHNVPQILLTQENTYVIPIIDAKNSRGYYARYNNKFDILDQCTVGDLREYFAKINDNQAKYIMLGDGALVNRELIQDTLGDNAYVCDAVMSTPRAAILAELASRREADNLYTLEPYYANKSQAERAREERK